MSAFIKKMYYYSIYLSYIIFGITALGLYKIAPQYLLTLNEGLKIFVSLFLIIRFNPLNKSTFTEFDKEISFSAGTFLLLTTTITSYLYTNIASQFIDDNENKKK